MTKKDKKHKKKKKAKEVLTYKISDNAQYVAYQELGKKV
jgi:hypothetical protein